MILFVMLIVFTAKCAGRENECSLALHLFDNNVTQSLSSLKTLTQAFVNLDERFFVLKNLRSVMENTPDCTSVILYADRNNLLQDITVALMFARVKTSLTLVSTLPGFAQGLCFGMGFQKLTFDFRAITSHFGSESESCFYEAKRNIGWKSVTMIAVGLNYPNFSPFVYIKLKQYATYIKREDFDGMDALVWDIIGHRLGLKFTYIFTLDFSEYITMMVNTTGDIGIHQPYFLHEIYNIGLDFSTVVSHEPYLFACAKPRPIRSYYLLTYPFDIHVWFSVIASTISVIVFLVLYNKFDFYK